MLTAVLTTTGCVTYGPPRAGESIYRDLVYASPGGCDLHLDLYVPPAARPLPVVIWFHGGSWKHGNKSIFLFMRDLPRHGIALVSVDYRLSDRAKYPAQIEDARAALQWVRAHAARYHLEPGRIGLSGASAGGHLAALLGTLEGTPAIRAVCVLYPPTDIVAMDKRYAKFGGLNWVGTFLGGSHDTQLALAAEASPINHVTASSPPFLIFHGALDWMVPVEQSRELHSRLLQAGVESQLVILPGKIHGFALDGAQIDKVVRFFRTYLSYTP